MAACSKELGFGFPTKMVGCDCYLYEVVFLTFRKLEVATSVISEAIDDEINLLRLHATVLFR